MDRTNKKRKVHKLRYSGDSGKYNGMTTKELKAILVENKVPGRSKLKTRYQIINWLERYFSN